MANRQRDPSLTSSGARKHEPPPPSWNEVDPREDATRPISRNTGAAASPPRKARKTGARPALSTDPGLPWDAQEDAVNLLADLPALPRVTSPPVATQSHSVPLPPPVSDFDDDDDEISVTSSLAAPVDQPRSEQRPAKSVSSEPKPPPSAPKKKSLKIAEFVRTTFAERLYGPVRYRLHIGEPPGSKTQSKRKARDPLVLVPSNEKEPSILCGWLDVSKKEAQVRSYSVMVLLHESRHGDEPDISEEEYEKFLRKLMDTLFDGGVRLVLLVPDTEDFEPTHFDRPAPRPAQRSPEPAAEKPVPARRALRPVLGVAFLVVLAFTLGMSAEHLFSWSTQVLSYFGHMPGWFAHALAWIRQTVPFLH